MSDSSLTIGEKRKLSQLEETIERGIKSFVDVGRALIEIRDRHLYTDVAGTFEAYCKKRWGFAKSRAYQFIEATKVVENLSTIGGHSPPDNERVAREIAEIQDENKQADVWTKAVETAPKGVDGKPKVTAAHVAKVRDEVMGEKPEPAKPAKEVSDAVGGVVPKKLLSVFEDAKEFESQARSLDSLLAWVREHAKETSGVFLHPQSIEADAENIKRALRFSKPYAVCPYCRGNGCKACRQSGFVSKGVYKAAPEDAKNA